MGETSLYRVVRPLGKVAQEDGWAGEQQAGRQRAATNGAREKARQPAVPEDVAEGHRTGMVPLGR